MIANTMVLLTFFAPEECIKQWISKRSPTEQRKDPSSVVTSSDIPSESEEECSLPKAELLNIQIQ